MYTCYIMALQIVTRVHAKKEKGGFQMKKRVIAVFLVVAMGVAMLAGCGTKAPDSQGGSGD